MQPILAESAPHRSRAMAIAVALTAVTSLVAALVVLSPATPSRHGFHRHAGKCPYVVVVR
jgi:hypothetical protein